MNKRSINWLGIIGLLVGLLGVVLSIYFYSNSIKSREPVFLVESNEKVFNSPTGVSAEHFRLVRRNSNEEIVNNIYSQVIVFWNEGFESIKSEHVLAPLGLKLQDGTEIIDAYISESQRPLIVKPNVEFEAGSTDVWFDFDILENEDGFKIKIIYIANEISNTEIIGQIEGVKNFRGVSDLTKSYIWLGALKTVSFLFLILGGLVLCLWFVDRTIKLSKKLLGYEVADKVGGFVSVFFLLLFLILITMAVYLNIVEEAGKSAKNAVPTMEVD